MMSPLRALSIAALASGALALGGCGGSSQATVTNPSGAGGAGLASLQAELVAAIAKATPTVVQVSTGEGLGSGVVVDAHGDIVTNAHVVGDAKSVRVTDSQGRTYGASLVGTFAPDDLAVVRADGASLPAARFGDSSALRVGDIVLALGNPLGLRSSVTEGIVSAVGRTVSEPDGAVLPDLIQTSASINPGNSGGALVDLEGKVVGIPTLAATDPELGGVAAGIGFAIPSSLVTDIARQIIEHGHVVNSHRAYLGLELATGLTSSAVVAAVEPDGPASGAGIVAGDTVTALAGAAVSDPSDVASILAGLQPRQSVTVSWTTAGGSARHAVVTLGEYPG